MEDIVARLSKVSASLGGKQVLTSLNLEVRRGQNWAVVGPNGAGKTTLLKIINGYQRPSSGSIEIFGEQLLGTDLREMRKKIGFVSSYMNELLVNEDNVLDIVVSGKSAATRLWEVPPAEDVKYALGLLRLMGCARYRDKRLRELSQGERQKILIARSLMSRPALLTLDEPCAGLDLKSRESFLSSLSKVAKRGKIAMIYVSHRIDEIPESFTHAILLRNGKAIAQGPINRVLTSANLSRCFGVDVKVKQWRGRYFPIVSAS